MSGTTEALLEARTAGTDDLTYGQLAAARKAAGTCWTAVLEPAEHGTLTRVVQRISAAIDARPVDLDGACERWPDWRFSREGEELVARSTDGLCALRADSPEAQEAEVCPYCVLRAWLARSVIASVGGGRAHRRPHLLFPPGSCTARRAPDSSTRAGTLVPAGLRLQRGLDRGQAEDSYPAQYRSPLGRRPYDLGHAAVSLWVNSGVPATEVARRAGHGVAVLLKIYAHCIDGHANAANQRITDALSTHDARQAPGDEVDGDIEQAS